MLAIEMPIVKIISLDQTTHEFQGNVAAAQLRLRWER